MKTSYDPQMHPSGLCPGLPFCRHLCLDCHLPPSAELLDSPQTRAGLERRRALPTLVSCHTDAETTKILIA